jgi:hypothetical protein
MQSTGAKTKLPWRSEARDDVLFQKETRKETNVRYFRFGSNQFNHFIIFENGCFIYNQPLCITKEPFEIDSLSVRCELSCDRFLWIRK